MEIEFQGLESLIKQLENLQGSIGETAHEGLLQSAAIVQGDAEKLCPVNDSNLRSHIVVDDVSQSEVGVVATAAHAIFVEFGTGAKGDPKVAHTTKKQWFVPVAKINPGSAKRYHFRRVDKKENGQIVQSWYIVRPQAPQPFMAPAIVQSEERVKKRMASELSRALREAKENAGSES